MTCQNQVKQSPLSSTQSTMPRNETTMEHKYQRSDYPNRKAVTNYPNVVPGSTPYLNIVQKGKKCYDLRKQYYWRNTKERI